MSDDDPMYEIPLSAINKANENSVRLGPYDQFVSDEQVYLWGLLWDAYQAFLATTWLGRPQKQWQEGGTWSGRCAGLADRITAATGLVGPVSWRNIPMSALVDGWFTWANQQCGIADPDLPNNDDLVYCRARLDEQIAAASVLGVPE
jgi:hypothetical protein